MLGPPSVNAWKAPPVRNVCLPDPVPRRRRSQILVVILVLAMAYSLALLWLHVPPQFTIAALGSVAAVTIRLLRVLNTDAAGGSTPPSV